MERYLIQIAIFFTAVISTALFTYGLTISYNRKREQKLLDAMNENNQLQKEIAKIQSRVIDQQENITVQTVRVADIFARATQGTFDIMKELRHEHNRRKAK